MKPDLIVNWKDIKDTRYAVVKKDHEFQTVILDPETDEIKQIIYLSDGEKYMQYKFAYDIFSVLIKE